MGIDFISNHHAVGSKVDWAETAYDILREWCLSKGPQATGPALLKALAEAELNSVAEEFRERLVDGRQYMTSLY